MKFIMCNIENFYEIIKVYHKLDEEEQKQLELLFSNKEDKTEIKSTPFFRLLLGTDPKQLVKAKKQEILNFLKGKNQNLIMSSIPNLS